MGKDTFYFSHDFNARHDEKITLLMMEHGIEGYGIFWAIVEDLYNNTNVLRTNYKRIAYELRVDEIKVKSIIEDFGLFSVNGDTFYSLSIQKRLLEREEKSKKAKESINKRWNKNTTEQKQDTNVLPKDTNVTEPDTNEPENDTKKERKEKERKENNNFLSNPTNDMNFLEISECRKIYEERYQVQQEAICRDLKIGVDKLKYFNDAFDLHVLKKDTNRVLSSYVSHFANWTAKLSPEQKQSILINSQPKVKEQSILEKYS